MRRIAAIVVVVVCATVAYGKPRPREFPTVNDIEHFDSSLPRAQRPSISAGAGDTIFYGGTTWMPDSMRWEAIRDSVWTFDTGVGSSINTGQNPNKPVGYHETMEGWFGYDLTLPRQQYFRRSTTCALSGNWSIWAGVTQHEADSLCYVTGQGYGNSWVMNRTKTFAYPGSGTVNLSFEYAIDSEPGFDYTYVVVDTTGAGEVWTHWCDSCIILRQYTGFESGTESLLLTPGLTLRSTPGPISIQILALSDGSYSDEDGLFTSTCGHSAFDNVALSGAIIDDSDFEDGEDGWISVPGSGYGDYANIALADALPPPATGPCALEDSVLVFFDPSLYQRIKEDLAVSPWIDLTRNNDQSRPGRLLAFDVHINIPDNNCPTHYPMLFARWFSSECSPNEFYASRDFRFMSVPFFGWGPYCTAPGSPWIVDLTGLIDPEAEALQIAIGCHTGGVCPFSATGDYDSTPWFDNVRFGVYGTPVAVPETPEPARTRLRAATPNPFQSTTRIEFTLSTYGRATIIILDLAGRGVRTLIDTEYTAGNHRVDWDGLDDSGQPVPNGLYFYRMTADGRSEAGKVVVLK